MANRDDAEPAQPTLEPADSERIGQATDAFRAALERNEGASDGAGHISKLLGDLAGPIRLALSIELVQIEWRHRWARTDPVRLEHYLATLPELGSNAFAVQSLLRFECRLRRESGDRVTIDASRSTNSRSGSRTCHATNWNDPLRGTAAERCRACADRSVPSSPAARQRWIRHRLSWPRRAA